MIGLVITIVIMVMGLIFGRHKTLNQAFFYEFLYNLMYSTLLTIINMTFMDYVYKNESWKPEKDYYKIIAAFLGSVPLTLIGIWFIRLFIEVGLRHRSLEKFIENQRFVDYLDSLIITFIVSLIFHVSFLYKGLQENKVKEQKILAGNASAQFESLKSQIDPHFLFNSLNVLSSLIEENPYNAQRFTTALSKIYRYVLEQKDKELVPLQEELDFAKTYMKLLTMRFENSLTYTIHNIEMLDDAKVVPLSLQLLLENTIKHNIVSDLQPLHVSIYEENGYLVVSNNLQEKEVLQNREGIGLANIVNRYGIISKKKVEVENDNNTFKVKIPILTEDISLIKNKNLDKMNAYLSAKKQVKDLKDFYFNLLTYCFIMPILIFINYRTFWDFKWFLFPMFGWGLGICINAFTIFGYGKTWEDRKIYELMEKDKQKNNQKWI